MLTESAITTAQHPSAGELKAFAQGLLDSQRSTAVEVHVARCNRCAAHVAGAPDDDFIGLLRAAEHSTFADKGRRAADTRNNERKPNAAPSPPAPLPEGEGSKEPSPLTALPQGEGSKDPSPPTYLREGEGSKEPSPSAHLRDREGRLVLPAAAMIRRLLSPAVVLPLLTLCAAIYWLLQK